MRLTISVVGVPGTEWQDCMASIRVLFQSPEFRRKHPSLLPMAALLPALSLAACFHPCVSDEADLWSLAAPPRVPVSATDAELVTFAGCAEAGEVLAAAMTPAPREPVRHGSGRRGWCLGPGWSQGRVDLAAGDASLGAERSLDEGFSSRTGVNLQEAGVDEADILQVSDEAWTYIAHAGDLLRTAARPQTTPPGAAVPLTRVSLARPVLELYLDPVTGRTLVLSGHGSVAEPFLLPLAWGRGGWATIEPAPMPGGRGGAGMPDSTDAVVPATAAETRVSLLDWQDATAPTVLREYHLDGAYLASRRLADGRLVVVTRFLPPAVGAVLEDPEIWQLRERYEQGALDMRSLRRELAARIAAAGDPGLVPKLRRTAGDPGEGSTCDQVRHIRAGQTPALLTAVWFIDPVADRVESTVLQQGADTVYASPDNLWLLQSGERWWFDAGAAGGSALWRIPLAATAPTVVAVGLVPGWVPSRMHLGEHAGTLRVFSHDGRATRLDVLDATTAGQPGVLGSVVDIAPGENLYGARFLGERAFAVTFLQVDPLFSFDLADPRNPRLAGELKIPGYGTYLHPLAGDRLLSVGLAGNEFQLTGGIALQLFDVADLGNPRRLAVLEPALDWSDSAALFEPRAFDYDPQSGLLAIPMTGDRFSGFGVFRVLEDHIVERGRVPHASGSEAWETFPLRSRMLEVDAGLQLLSLSTRRLLWSDLEADPPGALQQLELP